MCSIEFGCGTYFTYAEDATVGKCGTSPSVGIMGMSKGRGSVLCLPNNTAMIKGVDEGPGVAATFDDGWFDIIATSNDEWLSIT